MHSADHVAAPLRNSKIRNVSSVIKHQAQGPRPNCTFRADKHPDVNYETMSFAESTKGKQYTAAKQLPYLRRGKKLLHGQLVNMVSELLTTTTYINEILTTSDKPLVMVMIGESEDSRFVGLLDSGSTGRRKDTTSYISAEAAARIAKSSKVCTCTNKTTCTPLGCVTVNNCIQLELVHLATQQKQITMKNIIFRVMDKLGSDVDIIIGYNEMKTYNLTDQFRHLFTSPKDDSSEGKTTISYEVPIWTSEGAFSPPQALPRQLGSLSEKTSEPLLSSDVSETCLQMAYLNMMFEEEVEEKEKYITVEEDDDQIDSLTAQNPYDDWFSDEKPQRSHREVVEETIQKIKIAFPPEEHKAREQFIKLVHKYSTVFATELNEQPARIDPFSLELNDDNTWYTNSANRRPARLQALSKQNAIKKFVDKAIANKVIRTSQATAWSQILLTPKPNGSWRFCIDFRSLNAATKSNGWPIPNIRQLLQRIGLKKAKWYAVFDLTSGYNQAPLTEQAKGLTAFICSEGLFEWNRLAMGLKGAGSYFQSQMYNKVLKDLVQKILEVYMDDIITLADTIDELLQRVEVILIRLKSFGVTVNPEKVKIGLQEVEYVGHLIDYLGLSFTQEKRDKVLDFRLPTSAKQMKSFLGLTNQFRDHVPQYGTLVAELHAMIPNYKKNSNVPLKWTTELQNQFYLVQKEVSSCQKLFFLDDTSPVYLHTDASNYGIGAYLFQVVDQKVQPIRFISRTLNARERRWNTCEKEAYAIFYALVELEHLIRDRQFTLRTDSRNLTFLNSDKSPKVMRWKLAIQHFDFCVQHIKGVDNIEADAFSRLVHLPKKEEDPLELSNMEVVTELQEETKLPIDIYQTIKSVHGGIHGHGGVTRTLSLLATAKKKWAHMRNDVETYIKRCACCQKMSTLKPKINIKPFTLASYQPMQRICIDTIGPITVNDEKDNDTPKYVIVIIDAFSRYVNLYAAKDTTAMAALSALTDWVTTFGCPSEIVSDNGSQFVNELISMFLDATYI